MYIGEPANIIIYIYYLELVQVCRKSCPKPGVRDNGRTWLNRQLGNLVPSPVSEIMGEPGVRGLNRGNGRTLAYYRREMTVIMKKRCFVVKPV